MKQHFATISSLLLGSLLCAETAQSQAWAAHHGMTSAVYQSKFTDYNSKGYRLKQVDGYTVGSTPYFAAIWEKTTGPAYAAHHNMTSADYQSKFNTYNSQGYRLVLVDGYTSGGTTNFAAIWVKKTGGAYAAHHNMSSADYQSKFNTYTQQGYRLKWVSGYAAGNAANFAAIWEKTTGPAYAAHHNMTSADYQSKFNTYSGQGYRLAHVSAYTVGGTDYYAAMWEKAAGPGWLARHRMTALGYQNEFDNQLYSGYRLDQVSGYSRNGQPAFAAVWESTNAWTSADRAHIDKKVLDFMSKFSVPGTAIALVKDGRLLYAKGYGTMDKGTGDVPGPNTLFRVASVSKPITAVAAMKQIEGGKYKLGDKVFGDGAILGTTYGSSAYSSSEKAITVQHLLEHSAGGDQWNNNSDGNAGDPMFQQTSYNHSQLIGWVLDNRDPETTPGSKYAYSNFGYCVLGRVIEKKSGQTYENYVRDNILKPCGIQNMWVAADDLSGRRYNESVYYDSGDPYSMKVKRMDAHGGWIASPIDLLRLVVKADGFATKPDILSSASFSSMVTPSANNSGYAKGWSVNGSNYFHNGSFTGGGAIIVRAGNGLSWAFVMNTRWQGEADSMMWEVVNGIKQWPAHDLF